MPIQSTVFSALNQEMLLPSISGEGQYRLQIVGAGVMTIQFQDSMDGATYNALRVLDDDTGANATDMTAAGFFTFTTNYISFLPKLKVTAFTSGTLTVYVLPVPKNSGRVEFPRSSKTFDGAGQFLSLPAIVGSELWQVQIVGAGTLTLQLQDSYDGGVTYHPIQAFNMTSGVSNVDMTVAGQYSQVAFSALIAPRLAVSAFTSGNLTATVAISGRVGNP